MKFRKNQSGQSLVEYLVIVAIIAIGSIAVVRSLGQTIYTRFANITNALQGNNKELKIEALNASDYGKKSLDNFFKDAGASASGGGGQNESTTGPSQH